jgi:hypothetical protein
MKYLLYDTTGMADNDVLLLKEIHEALSAKYKTQLMKQAISQILNIGQNADVAGILSLQSGLKRAHIIFTKLKPTQACFEKTNRQNYFSSFHFILIVFLNRNFGKVFIRQKTFFDKIMSSFLLDNQILKRHLEFSRRFIIMSNDDEYVNTILNENFKSLLKSMYNESFSINIEKNNLQIDCHSMMTTKKILKMADFACELSVINFK